jgi:hypothetical protein
MNQFLFAVVTYYCIPFDTGDAVCFLVYVVMLSDLHWLYSIKWEKCWVMNWYTCEKKFVVACFDVLPQLLTGGSDKSHETPCQDSDPSNQDTNPGPEYEL